MGFGVILDSSMDPMEETRFKKKNDKLIKRLTKGLHFDQTEIECLLIFYYKLQKDNPEKSPGVTRAQFRDVLHKTLDMTDDFLIDRIFMALDRGLGQKSRGTNAFISMETWCSALSLFLRGTLDERIHYCFQVYDITGDGLLGREAMFYLLRSSVMSQSIEESEELAKDLIEIITKKVDIDRDGKISFNDYRQSVLNEPMLLEVFGQCLPSRMAIHAFCTTFTTRNLKV